MSDNDTKLPASPISSNILDKIMGSQNQSNLTDFQPQAMVSDLLSRLKERDREILSKRFGLLGSELETLESIGKAHNLTRERVRQIEKDTISLLRKKQSSHLTKALQVIFDTIMDHGNIMSEELLMQTVVPNHTEDKEAKAVKFLLNLGDQFKNLKETPEYYESWYTAGFDLALLQRTVSEFTKILEAGGKAINQEELYSQFKQSEFYQQNSVQLTDRVIKSYLSIAKIIQFNPFNEIGLKNWSEIKPRDVGDKAYLVLKHHGKPEHYSVITKLINDSKFDGRTAFQETVHNELIKDNRFVLIGRGIYALSEWGYTKGVVADVIREIFKSYARPMSREEIIAEVLKRRQVKRNTILVGLSNRKIFQKVGKDKYTLVNEPSN